MKKVKSGAVVEMRARSGFLHRGSDRKKARRRRRYCGAWAEMEEKESGGGVGAVRKTMGRKKNKGFPLGALLLFKGQGRSWGLDRVCPRSP